VYLPASEVLYSLLATSIGIAGAACGVSSAIGAPRKIVPFSGGLLMGIGFFGVLPELAEENGWLRALAFVALGVGSLWVVDRFVHPICPSCSHTHDHDHCSTELHGFAGPLITAAAVHAFLDGLGISAAGQGSTSGLVTAVAAGVTLHKIPEGIALGIMLRAAVRSRWSAFLLCAAAEAATLLGSVFESAITSQAGAAWVTGALALAGGSFLYLGFHAVHGEWRRYGAPVFVPGLIGAAGAAALQQGVRVFFH
jgi:zinc transporter ZupT